MVVYPSKMAPFGLKLWENAFQTIPDISFFDAENQKKCRTLNGRLPLEYDSVRPQTLGKCVSDDSQHFIFRRRKKFFWPKFLMKIFVKNFVGKSTNCLFLRSYGFLDVIGRCASKSYPQSFDFQLSTTFGGGVKEIVSIFAPDFRPKMTSTLFVFWLEDTCILAICPGHPLHM